MILDGQPVTCAPGPCPILLDPTPLEVGEIQVTQIVAYVHAVEVDDVGRYIVAVAAAEAAAEAQAQADALAGYLAALRANAPRPAAPAPRTAPAPVPAAAPTSSPGGFLACVRQRESGGNYGVYNSGGSGAAGAYQFMPATWDGVAKSIGRYDLVGVSPAAASPADQDMMAQALYAQQGTAPWAGGNYAC